METKQNVYDNITTNQRRVITVPQAYEYTPDIVVPLDKKESIILLRSRSTSLVNIVYKSYDTFTLLEDLLKYAEQKLSDATAPPKILDELGVKP